MLTIATRLITFVLVPLLFVLSGPDAKAVSIVRDWQMPGDGLLTLDTATGLQWLDVTVTQGLAWDVVTSELEVGGRFAGFRRPTEAEIATFWADAGIPNVATDGSFNATVANFEPVKSLQQLWGNTGQFPFGPPGVTATWTTTTESFDPVDNMIEGTALLRLFESEGTAAAQIRVLLGGPPTQPVPDVAHALVQSVPVPEPPTVILFIIGIASYGLIRTRWRATYNKGRCNIIHLRVTGTVP